MKTSVNFKNRGLRMIRWVLCLLFVSAALYGNSKESLVMKADELLESKLSYYLYKNHDLHPSQIKIIRNQGASYYLLKQSGSETEKLAFLLKERENSIVAMSKMLLDNPSEAIKTQLVLCRKSIINIKKHLL